MIQHDGPCELLEVPLQAHNHLLDWSLIHPPSVRRHILHDGIYVGESTVVVGRNVEHQMFHVIARGRACRITVSAYHTRRHVGGAALADDGRSDFSRFSALDTYSQNHDERKKGFCVDLPLWSTRRASAQGSRGDSRLWGSSNFDT